jgi:cell division protein FtsW (lipid II flippase)
MFGDPEIHVKLFVMIWLVLFALFIVLLNLMAIRDRLKRIEDLLTPEKDESPDVGDSGSD